MSKLNARFALPAAAIVVLWQVASLANAATIGILGDPVAGTAGQQKTWLHESPRKSATDMSILAKNGATYNVTLESEKLNTVRFTNRLFLSESLDSSDIDREMQIAFRANSNQKLLFTNVVVAAPAPHLDTSNIAILPTDVDIYLKAMSSELKGILKFNGDGDDNSAYMDIKQAISLNGSETKIDKKQLQETIIVSREYGGVTKAAVELESMDASGLAKIVSMIFSQTTLFIVVFAMVLMSMVSRIFTRSRPAHSGRA